MTIKKVYTMYFSPTGGTEKAVDLVGSAWPKSEDIDLSVFGADYSRYQFTPDELCIIGVPSFGGRVPNVALTHLAQMKGDGTPAVLVVSYGNRAYDDAFLELKDTVEAAGFVCIAAVAAVTEHSIAHRYGAGRPDQTDEAELRQISGQIQRRLEGAESPQSIEVPGNRPYRDYTGVPMKPKASGKCVSCGVCARRCPVGAIPVDSPNVTEKEKCISCMRCIQVCPVHARKCSSLMIALASHKLKKVCSTRKNNELI
ncbi:EFR1 family ferrodoxin [Bariatricus massiliensis]|uniref:EFR1 family ferrodoxin n=1 Tax=Bariatricus massiliensis TaxID=1745713 RepID=A0ABS8DE58_9FIRM|nr:EFR1 family ferrodoxin [Bariatricus massiliensis]MCB7302805.1 EFR1 family ferrodoxin [Bariatricus massiliensis]MCB7374021.1 EFR1 family ferrodoxin [Bariatricus massiliensis]MCB7386691.1 EFR1 family ferrodoxin [Bariatricus massiliensis]MCB7410853.1 EFR1 family ferrodoxin [Bariatricus massiliensis]MCQ5251677.1 EFR1 family ferrodoxin [Bariatricus massiliensis]